MLEPRDLPPAVAAGVPAETPHTGTPPLALLVIDDDTVHRMILTRVAGRAGFAATGAATYEEAVALIERQSFDAITLDLTLGAHGGVEVLHHLAAMDFKAPIIIVSSSTEAIRRETAGIGDVLSLNVTAALAKPVDLARLREILTGIRDRNAVGLMPCSR